MLNFIYRGTSTLHKVPETAQKRCVRGVICFIRGIGAYVLKLARKGTSDTEVNLTRTGVTCTYTFPTQALTCVISHVPSHKTYMNNNTG